MDATTERLVAFASRSSYGALPPKAVHECKRRLIDSFACTFGSYDEPLARMARATASKSRPSAGSPSARIWGCDDAVPPESAAFANGVMMRLADLSDMYGAKGAGHPSDVLPALLAVAESEHASGQALIATLALAYDVYCTLCEAIPLSARGWDQPVMVAIASAVASGKLLGLTSQQLGDAVALALAPNMALYQTRRGVISSWKGAASANAARNAVFATYLASDGFEGPTAVFDGECGFRQIVGAFDWAPEAGEETPHRITRTNMKCFPICYHGQSAVWCALDLHKAGVDTEAIEVIEIETYAAAIKLMADDPSRWAPESRDTADHSLPYVIAVALREGMLNAESFSEDRLRDVRIRALMRKVKVSENPGFTERYPAATPARVTLHLSTGQVRVSEMAQSKGHILDPLSDQEVESKFRDLFRHYGDAVQGERILQALWNFDRCEDVAQVVTLFTRQP